MAKELPANGSRRHLVSTFHHDDDDDDGDESLRPPRDPHPLRAPKKLRAFASPWTPIQHPRRVSQSQCVAVIAVVPLSVCARVA